MKKAAAFILCFILFLLFDIRVPVPASAQQVKEAQNKDENQPEEVKVLKQYKDKYGNTVRVVQYKRGLMNVTETTVAPPFPSLNERKKIDFDTLDKDSVMILVEKHNYLVAVIYKKRRIRHYKATFGPNRLVDKMYEGDRATPEGYFKILSVRNHGEWGKFLLLDYPNEDSYQKFREWKANAKIPSDARIGHSVGIHGTHRGADDMVDLSVGWTDGCIALKNSDLLDLCKFVQPGTKVVVRSKSPMETIN